MGVIMKEEFNVKEQHLKLLKRMYVSWWDCEFGAPAIDPKRPYGNSDVVVDIAEILDYDINDENGYPCDRKLEEYEEELYKFHQEMRTVLQILLNNIYIEEGIYIRENYGDWKKF